MKAKVGKIALFSGGKLFLEMAGLLICPVIRNVLEDSKLYCPGSS